MKAVDCVRKTVLAVLIAETSELTALPDENGRNGVREATSPVPAHCAIAADEAYRAAATATAPKRPFLIFIVEPPTTYGRRLGCS